MARRVLALAASCLALVACGGERTVQPTAEEVQGTLPQAKPVSGGDAEAGKELFTSQGCNSCHTFEPAGTTGTVGPDLDELEAHARAAGEPLDQYTREAIVAPDAYVVPGFQKGVMPSTYESSIPKEQLDALVQYLVQNAGRGSQ